MFSERRKEKEANKGEKFFLGRYYISFVPSSPFLSSSRNLKRIWKWCDSLRSHSNWGEHHMPRTAVYANYIANFFLLISSEPRWFFFTPHPIRNRTKNAPEILLLNVLLPNQKRRRRRSVRRCLCVCVFDSIIIIMKIVRLLLPLLLLCFNPIDSCVAFGRAMDLGTNTGECGEKSNHFYYVLESTIKSREKRRKKKVRDQVCVCVCLFVLVSKSNKLRAIKITSQLVVVPKVTIQTKKKRWKNQKSLKISEILMFLFSRKKNWNIILLWTKRICRHKKIPKNELTKKKIWLFSPSFYSFLSLSSNADCVRFSGCKLISIFNHRDKFMTIIIKPLT